MPDSPPTSGATPTPPRDNWRSRHRSASHASAHAQPSEPLPPVPNLPLVPPGPAELVTDAPALANLLDQLRTAKIFAYDSEFIGETSYEPRLCLVQVATAQHVWLIDPLAPGDDGKPLNLDAFWQLLCDDSVLKIVHAGEQDIEPAVRHTGHRPRGFFDTQIAAGFVGIVYPVALSKLVAELIGVRLGKGLTFSHWEQRPLSAMQMRYAADDVRYLPALHAALLKPLQKLGHEAWAAEACDALCEPSRHRFDPTTAVGRVRGSGSLDRPGAAVLLELVAWRNQAARQADLPPRAFLRDEVFVDLCRRPAKSPDQLSRVRGLPRPIAAQSGQEIVQATLRGLAAPRPPVSDRPTEPTPRQRFAADSLWAAAQSLCASRQIDIALVTTRQETFDLFMAIQTAPSQPPDFPLLRGWRRAALGDDLLNLLAGRSQLTMAWRGGILGRS